MGNKLAKALKSLVIGDKIGEGQFRKVYECAWDPSLVVKVAKPTWPLADSNIAEWDIWVNFRGVNKVSRWFVPCEAISEDGVILIQKKGTPLCKLPKRVPDFLADVKLENWVMYDGKPRVCDYDHHRFYTLAEENFKLVDPETL